MALSVIRAGQQARRISANEEAIAPLTQGLILLEALPDAPERPQQELDFLIALGPAVMTTKGFGNSEVELVYSRAHELCQQIGETTLLTPVLRGLCTFYHNQAKYQMAWELGTQLMDLVQHMGDPVLLVEAHFGQGATLFTFGELVSARVHLEQAIAMYDPERHHAHAFRHGQDPGVAARIRLACVLQLLGYPDQALERNHEALALAKDLSHPFSLSYALGFSAHLHQFRREVRAVLEQSGARASLAIKHRFAFHLAIATILRGWALTEQGQVEEGTEEMYQGLAAARATGSVWGRPYFLGILAEIYGKAGRTEEGLSTLAEALVAAESSDDRYYEAELYRLKGELLLTPDKPEAEVCFRQAVEIARRQRAKSWELRATVSLCQLLQQQGRGEEGRQMLAEIYGWFTEGFDTPDLIKAKALLDELS